MTSLTVPHLRTEDGSLAEGANVAGYRIVKRLGKGGFGVVYLAENDIGQKVALKQFLMHGLATTDSGLSSDERDEKRRLQEWALRRFKETTRDLAQLEHPNIVKVLNYVPLGDTAVMMMNFVEGTTLEDGLRNAGGVLSLARLRPYIEPIFDAFEYLHSKGLVHRDFKTENVMIRSDGNPVLIDFGSLRMIEQEYLDRANDISNRFGRPTTTYAVVSQGYAAPEQYNPLIKPQPTMDVYAMGGVLYRIVTGEPPVDALKRDASRLTGTVDPLRPLAPDLSKALDMVGITAIGRALALSPANRPQTMAMFRAELGWKSLPLVDPVIVPHNFIDRRTPSTAAAQQVAHAGTGLSNAARESRQGAGTGLMLTAGLVVLIILGAIIYMLVIALGPSSSRVAAPPPIAAPAPPGASAPLETSSGSQRLGGPPSSDGNLGRVQTPPVLRSEEAAAPTLREPTLLRRDVPPPLNPNPPRTGTEGFSPPALSPSSPPLAPRPLQ